MCDIYDLKEGHDKYYFMERITTDSSISHVLVVCDKTYAKKSDLRIAGVGTESQIISQQVYESADQSRIIPIVCEFDENEEPTLPVFLKSRIWLNFSNEVSVNENWERLVRLIYGKPQHAKPKIGITPIYITNHIPVTDAVTTVAEGHDKSHTKLKIKHNDPILILHISDLQLTEIEPAYHRLESRRLANYILKYWNDNIPTFLALTGDFVENASPSQYITVLKWLEYFTESLGFDNFPKNIILPVPGNHDVNLFLAAATSNQKDLLGYTFEPFRKFVSEISDCPLLKVDHHNNSFAWVETRYKNLGIVFYGLSTIQPVIDRNFPEKKVNENDLYKIHIELNETIDKSGEDIPLIIGLGHHCPVFTRRDCTVDNSKLFEMFFRGKAKTAIFLHGHSHENELSLYRDNDFRLVLSGIATKTMNSKSYTSGLSFNGCNLLTLERINHKVTSLSGCCCRWFQGRMEIHNRFSWRRMSDGMFEKT